MILVDLNVLIFAFNENAPQHDRARGWIEMAFSGEEAIGLPWSVVQGFLRITTNTRAVQPPLRMADALEVVEEWFSSPAVTLVEPGIRYCRSFDNCFWMLP